MEKTSTIIKFASIVVALLALTIILIIVNYDFFLDVDYRTNKTISINTTQSDIVINKDGTREYKIIYDENIAYSVELKDDFARLFEITKVKYRVYEKEDYIRFSNDDYIILTLIDWSDNKDLIENVFESVNNGCNLFISFSPVYDDYFMSKANILAIKEAKDKTQSVFSEGFVILDDILLGFQYKESIINDAISDYIYDIKLDTEAKVFLETDGGEPIYFTNEYGDGCIGVYNGQNLHSRYLNGLLVGILGTMGDDYIYPIVNSGVMFIDDWPAPFRGENKIIQEHYDMNVDDFMRYIWWPDMLALAKQFDMSYMGQYILTYTDITHEPFIVDGIDFDTSMYAFGQQILKYDGELGLHGYNHQPLRYSDYSEESGLDYTKWDSYEESVTALMTAVDVLKESFPDYEMNSYVPPSNVIDEEGIEAVKEVLGEPVVISGMYNADEVSYVDPHEVEYKNDVIYLPRFSSGYFPDDGTMLNLVNGVSMYGIVSHFIHPDDVMDQERNRGYSWDDMVTEYSKLVDFINERYPFIQFETATEAGGKVVDWHNQDYVIDYEDDYIRVRTKYDSDSTSMILRTEKEVLKSDDYDVMQLGNLSYYVNINKSDVKILLKGN